MAELRRLDHRRGRGRQHAPGSAARISGDFFWSGGFTDTGTHDLADLNQPDPSRRVTTRTVGTNPANIRDLPYTDSPAKSSANGGTVIDMDGFTHGDEVEGNDVWFRRKADADWMWSGGFTSQATEGLTEVPTPDPPDPVSDDNPRGLPEYTPVWALAFQGLEAPLGFMDCANPVDRALRDNAGGVPVEPVIDTYIVHWTGTMVDQMDYFSYCNSRSVCPTMYMRRDGSQSEMIRPGAKPAATGPDWNWRSFAVETLGAEGNDFTDEQWEAHAQNIAHAGDVQRQERWTACRWSSPSTGSTCSATARRLPGSTECPGDNQIAGLDALIARAQEIYDDDPDPEPEPDPGPLDPADYPTLSDLRDELDRAFGEEGADDTRGVAGRDRRSAGRDRRHLPGRPGVEPPRAPGR